MARTNLMALVTVVVAVLSIAACGDSRSESTPMLQPYSCAAGGLMPPSRLIIPPRNGISGRWNVVLVPGEASLHDVAAGLAAKYGGTVLAEWELVNGFALALADEQAQPLSEEPAVCYVEQDIAGSLPALPGTES